MQRSVDVNGDGVINDADLEDTNTNGLLDPGEDTNGNGRLDNDPIPGNLNPSNDWTVVSNTATAIKWGAGTSISAINLIGFPFGTPLQPGDPEIAFMQFANLADPSTLDPETIDDGPNVLDGFVVTIDDLDPGEIISFDWFLTDANGEIINSPEIALSPYGFGVVNFTSLDGPAFPGAVFSSNTGFSQSPKLFFDSVYHVPNPADFAAEFGAAITAEFLNPTDNVFNIPVTTQLLNRLEVTPNSDTNPIGTPHTVTAALTDGQRNPVSGQTVEFRVSGVNPASGQAATDTAGEAAFTYTGNNAGDDTLTVWADENGDGLQDPAEPFDVVTKTWFRPTGPTLSVSMSVVSPQPILSGNPVTWEISWQCSSVDATPCTGARIDVTKPTLTGEGSAVGSPGFTTSAFVDATGAHYIFIDPLPAGSSGTMLVQYFSVNLHTPDGTVLTPVATFSATNATSVQASAGAEIEAATHLTITKRRGCFFCGAAAEPPLDVDVTYEINVFDSSWPNYSNPLPGTWTVVNAVVTDTLPPGSVFVSATDGGVYDAATHTVTWLAIPEVAAYEAFGHKFYVTIRYPSSQFTADDDPADPSDNVTNSATVVSKPFGLPIGPDVTAQASATHGFLNQPLVNGNFLKTDGHNSGVRGGSEIAPFRLFWDNRNSSVPATFTGIDRLPCQVTSPTGPLTPCANPGFRLTRFVVELPIISGAVTVNYTTNLGNTGTISFNASLVYKSPGVDDDIPRTFSPGEFVSHFTVTGTVAGGLYQIVLLYGTIAPDFPDDPATETEVMTNCAQGSLDFGAFGGVQGPFNGCNTLEVVPAKPVIYHFKNGISLGAIAPTEARTFVLSAAPCGDLPWRPVFTDLLPANLRYVPGSQTSNSSGFPSLGGVPPTFEVIEDFNGTGRQLLRWSWPGGQAMTECQYLEVRFQARVEPGTPPGTYVNYSQFFDAAFTNNNTPLTNICIYDREPDAGDFDGDGNTTEYRCLSGIGYTVVETASMVVTKEVRGSFDDAFTTPPAIGLVNPGSTAEYRITLQNTGNLSLTNFVAYDIFPFVGDTGVSGMQLGTPRGSQWQPTLAGAVTPPAGGTVEYSLSTNPCRGEVITQGGALASGPVGCVNDWTPSPASFSAVRAIRINLGSTVLAGGESRTVTVSIAAPTGVEGIAWNSVALAGQNADTSTWLLPTELAKVGLAIPIDLELDKTVSPTTSVLSGATLTYTSTVTNRGPGSATGVVVKDVLPPGLTFQSATPAAAYDSNTGVWTVGDLAVNESATLTITATVNAGTEGTTITNYAQVSAANEIDLDSAPDNNAGPTPSEDDEDAVSTPISTSKLIVVKHVINDNSGTAVAGGFTMSVSAANPNPASFPGDENGTIVALDAGDYNVAESGPSGYTTTFDGCSGSIAVGETKTCTVTNDDIQSPPDLVIVKSDGRDTVKAGQTLTYTLTISNGGAQAATGVTVTDTLPALTAFVAASDGGSASSGLVTWPAFDLAAGTSVSRTVTVKVTDMLPGGGSRTRDTRTWTDPGGSGRRITFSTPEHYSGCRPPATITNKATVADDGTHGSDPTPENNTASDTDRVIASDVIWTRGIPNNWSLAGWVRVEYITDSGRILIKEYRFRQTGNLRLTITYPPVREWPVMKSGVAEIHVDLSIRVYDNNGKPVRWVGGDQRRAPGVLGPGQDWDVWCRVTNR